MAELLDATTTEPPQSHNQRTGSYYPLATWLALRKDYIQGKGTLEPLCQKHGVVYDTAKTKSAEEDWTGQRRTWLERATKALVPPQEKELVTPPTQPQSASDTKLGQVERQLGKIDLLIEDSDDPKELNSLVQAKERLLNAWSLLTGFERPGIRRRSSKRSSYQSAQPIEPDPVPVQAIPARPLGWEYDG